MTISKMELSDIKEMCIEVDIENIGDNDFDTEEEVRAWWDKQPAKKIMKIFDEYYGYCEAINGNYNTETKIFDFEYLMKVANKSA